MMIKSIILRYTKNFAMITKYLIGNFLKLLYFKITKALRKVLIHNIFYVNYIIYNSPSLLINIILRENSMTKYFV